MHERVYVDVKRHDQDEERLAETKPMPHHRKTTVDSKYGRSAKMVRQMHELGQLHLRKQALKPGRPRGLEELQVVELVEHHVDQGVPQPEQIDVATCQSSSQNITKQNIQTSHSLRH